MFDVQVLVPRRSWGTNSAEFAGVGGISRTGGAIYFDEVNSNSKSFVASSYEISALSVVSYYISQEGIEAPRQSYRVDHRQVFLAVLFEGLIDTLNLVSGSNSSLQKFHRELSLREADCVPIDPSYGEAHFKEGGGSKDSRLLFLLLYDDFATAAAHSKCQAKGHV